MRKMFVVLNVIVVNLVLFNTTNFSQIKFGIRGGLNFANVSEDLGGTESFDFEGTNLKLPLEQTNRTTYDIGGFIEFPFSPMFYLQINALYNQKGFNIEGDLNTTLVEQGIPVNVTVNAEQTIKLSYISFPILGKLILGDNIKPYIIAGPEIGFLLSGKSNAKATSEAEAMGTKVGPYTVEQEADIKESMESLELAINLGAGLIMPLGTLDVFVDAQYSLGLTNIGKDRLSFGEDIKNQVIVINIGMIFGSK